jgi:hypothetical protein
MVQDNQFAAGINDLPSDGLRLHANQSSLALG